MKLLTLAAVTVASANAFGQNLVINGGFETGDFTGWNRQANEFLGIEDGGGALVHSGLYSVHWAGTSPQNDSIDQEVSALTGVHYELSLWVRSANTSTTDHFDVVWGGQTLFSNTITSTTWMKLTFEVFGGPNATTNLYLGGYGGANGIYADDVAIAVPEPGSVMALSLGAIVLLRRKRLQQFLQRW
jgi:hypothetical protein